MRFERWVEYDESRATRENRSRVDKSTAAEAAQKRGDTTNKQPSLPHRQSASAELGSLSRCCFIGIEPSCSFGKFEVDAVFFRAIIFVKFLVKTATKLISKINVILQAFEYQQPGEESLEAPSRDSECNIQAARTTKYSEKSKFSLATDRGGVLSVTGSCELRADTGPRLLCTCSDF